MSKGKPSVADKIVAGLEEFADALEVSEEIPQQFNSRRVMLDLKPGDYDPQRVKETRQTLKASQQIFAQFLGISVESVRAWEQGKKLPSDMARRFMDEIRAEPEYWQARLRKLMRPRNRRKTA